MTLVEENAYFLILLCDISSCKYPLIKFIIMSAANKIPFLHIHLIQEADFPQLCLYNWNPLSSYSGEVYAWRMKEACGLWIYQQ